MSTYVRASLATPELLEAIENFEAVDCEFGRISTAYIRCMAKYPQAETFNFQDVMFRLSSLPAALLILGHVWKPDPANPERRTVRPFGELLVQHGLSHARLMTTSATAAHVEVSRDGSAWRKLAIQPQEASHGTP